MFDALLTTITNSSLLLAVLAAAVQSSTPVLYATLGEVLAERSGVLNLGVEGMMIIGAFFGFLGLYLTGSAWVGFACAGLAGGLGGSIHAFLCVVLRSNQVVSGLAFTILGVGLVDYLGAPFVGTRTVCFSSFALPVLADIPVRGTIFFKHDALVYLSYFFAPALWVLLRYSRWGLNLRAAGENPAAVIVAGLPVLRIRWVSVFWGGVLAGFGGGYLSLAYTHMWTNNITAGRGWIAVALVIFAFWRPMRAMWGAYLFYGIIAMQMQMQAQGVAIPSSLLLMLPYVLTLAALVYSSMRGKGRGAPAMLGVNLEPEE